MDSPKRIQDMKSRLEFTYCIGKEDLNVTVSMGAISPCHDMLLGKPAHISSGEFFLELADRRMYIEKKISYGEQTPSGRMQRLIPKYPRSLADLR